jgi:hypothetical protein
MVSFQALEKRPHPEIKTAMTNISTAVIMTAEGKPSDCLIHFFIVSPHKLL